MPLDQLDSLETQEQWEKYQEICRTFKPTQGRSYQTKTKAIPSLELELQVLEVISQHKGVTASEIAVILQYGVRTIQGKILRLRNSKKISRSRKRSGLSWEYEAIENADQSFDTADPSTSLCSKQITT